MKHFLLTLVLVGLASPTLVAQDIPLSKILVENEPWKLLAQNVPNVKYISYLLAHPQGDVGIYQLEQRAVLRANGALEPVPLPRFLTPYFDQTDVKTSKGVSYSIQNNQVRAHLATNTETWLAKGLAQPSCLTVWPDEGHLVIGDRDGAWLWAVRIESDGRLGPGDRYYSLRTRPGEKLNVTSLTMDAGYLLYACTSLGVQVFDPTGRLSGVIPAPSRDEMTALTIGGAKGDTLYLAAGTSVYGRKIQGKASYTLPKEKSK